MKLRILAITLLAFLLSLSTVSTVYATDDTETSVTAGGEDSGDDGSGDDSGGDDSGGDDSGGDDSGDDSGGDDSGGDDSGDDQDGGDGSETDGDEKPAASLQCGTITEHLTSIIALCKKYEKEYKTAENEEGDKVWTETHAKIFNGIVEHCAPKGEEGSVGECDSTHKFGLELQERDVTSQDPPGFTKDNKFEPGDAKGHIDLFISGVGTNKVIDKLIDYHVKVHEKRDDEAKAVFESDPFLRMHKEDAAKQPDRYTGIIGRTYDMGEIAKPPYEGDAVTYFKEQFYMGDKQIAALKVLQNHTAHIANDGDKKEDLYKENDLQIGTEWGNVFTYTNSDAAIEAGAEIMGEHCNMEGEGASCADFGKKVQEYNKHDEALAPYIQEEKNKLLLQVTHGDDGSGWDKFGQRLLNPDGMKMICYRAGEQGISLPLSQETCKSAYKAGLRSVNEDFEDDEQYADESTGKFSEEKMFELIQKNREEQKKKKLEELGLGESDNPIGVLAAHKAVSDIAKIDIRNNPQQFAKADSLFGGETVKFVDKNKAAEALEKAKAETGGKKDGGAQSLSGDGDVNPFSVTQSNPNSGKKDGDEPWEKNGEEKKERTISSETGSKILAHAGKPLEPTGGFAGAEGDDDPFASSSGGDPFYLGTEDKDGVKPKYYYVQQSPDKRDDLKYFPEAVAAKDPENSDGVVMLKTASGRFCTPENYVLKFDPTCSCMHSKHLLVHYEDLSCKQGSPF